MVPAKGLRLYKREKLCSRTALQWLFVPDIPTPGDTTVHTAMAYPWRAVWRQVDDTADRPTRFVIQVPKKRLRHAVDRVRMRRLMREAYRLHRHEWLPAGPVFDVAFVYVAPTLTTFSATCRSLAKLTQRMARSIEHEP